MTQRTLKKMKESECVLLLRDFTRNVMREREDGIISLFLSRLPPQRSATSVQEFSSFTQHSNLESTSREINSNTSEFFLPDSLSHLYAFINQEKENSSHIIMNHFLNLLPLKMDTFQCPSYNSSKDQGFDESSFEKKEENTESSNVKNEENTLTASQPSGKTVYRPPNDVTNTTGIDENVKPEDQDTQDEVFNMSLSLTMSLILNDPNYLPPEAKLKEITPSLASEEIETRSTVSKLENSNNEIFESNQAKTENSQSAKNSVSTGPLPVYDITFIINNFSRENLRNYLMSWKKVHDESTLQLLEGAYQFFKGNKDVETLFKNQIDKVALDEMFDEEMNTNQ